MEKIISDTFGNSGLIIGIMIIIYFITKITPIFKGIRLIIVSWFNLDNNKRIKVLSDNLDSIKEENNNTELIEIIKYEIDSLIYTNLTGYSWHRDKQLNFLEFYNKVKGKMSLKRFKLLYSNCSIDKDKIVSVKITNNNKSDQFFKYFMAVMSFIIFLWTFILSIQFHNETLQVKLVLALLSISSFCSGGIFFIQANNNRRFFKMIKDKYDNYII